MHARNVREIKFSSLTSVKIIHSLPFVHSEGIFIANQITTRKIIYFRNNSIYRKRGKHFGSGPYRGTGSNPSKRLNLPTAIHRIGIPVTDRYTTPRTRDVVGYGGMPPWRKRGSATPLHTSGVNNTPRMT